MKLLRGLVAIVVCLGPIAGNGYASSPPGYVIAIGGGGSLAPDGTPKRSMVDAFRAGLEQMKISRSRGAQLGNKVCLVEHGPGASDLVSGPESAAAEGSTGVSAAADSPELKVLLAAGLPSSDLFASFLFSDRTAANDTTKVSELAKTCGLIYLPGGDQNHIREAWTGTPLLRYLTTFLASGGGIIGKSAGAAVIGAIVYYPTVTDPVPKVLLERMDASSLVANHEIETGFITPTLPNFPTIYVETHSGERERSARALAILAAWQAIKPAPAARGFSAAIDVDTALLITYDVTKSVWSGQVIGTRSAEFSFPRGNSKGGLTKNGKPYFTAMASSVLTEGYRVILNGTEAGAVVDKNGTRITATESTPERATAVRGCFARLPPLVHGSSYSSGEDSSEFVYRARNPQDGTLMAPESFEAAYVTGDLVHVDKRTAEGCGVWISRSYDPDIPDKATRLAMQRYAIGKGWVDFAAGLGDTMRAENDVASGSTRFAPDSGGGSSVLLFDGRNAVSRGVGTYNYAEYATPERKIPTEPIQIGTWVGGTSHLLPPGAVWNWQNGQVTVP